MPIRLLVIDDSLTIRKLVELSFRSGDYALEFAASGADGLEKARGGVDVILLDFILPDMKGLTVVARLAEDTRTAALPIVIMTAKTADVRGQFKGYPAVIDFVTKPFSSELIAERIGKAARTRAKDEPEAAQQTTRKDAAQVLFSRLRGGLGKIPDWQRELGDAPAATFFARKLLTPAMVDDILTGLAPLLGSGAAPAPAPTGLLSGRLEALPFPELVAAVGRAKHTGEVQLTVDEREYVLWFKDGDLVFANSSDPEGYGESAGLDLQNVPYEVYARAAAEHRGGGKPLPLTLAEGGHVAIGSLGKALFAQSKHVVRGLLQVRAGRFVWALPTSLPPWVEAHASVVSLLDLELARLRADTTPSGEPLAPEAVLDRAPGFSRRVTELGLTPVEAQLVAQVDGRASVAGLVASTGLAADVVHRTLRALRDVGVLVEKTDSRRAAPAGGVLVWDADVRGVCEPLERYLRNRAQPLRLTRVESLAALGSALERERATLYVINAADAGDEALQAARLIAATGGRKKALAVLESLDTKRAHELTQGGFDRVTVKPVHFSELEQLIQS